MKLFFSDEPSQIRTKLRRRLATIGLYLIFIMSCIMLIAFIWHRQNTDVFGGTSESFTYASSKGLGASESTQSDIGNSRTRIKSMIFTTTADTTTDKISLLTPITSEDFASPQVMSAHRERVKYACEEGVAILQRVVPVDGPHKVIHEYGPNDRTCRYKIYILNNACMLYLDENEQVVLVFSNYQFKLKKQYAYVESQNNGAEVKKIIVKLSGTSGDNIKYSIEPGAPLSSSGVGHFMNVNELQVTVGSRHVSLRTAHGTFWKITSPPGSRAVLTTRDDVALRLLGKEYLDKSTR